MSAARFFIGNLVPQWPMWPDDEEQQLFWDIQENEAYFNELYGADVRLLPEGMQAPTVLHSNGSLLRSCPCGCRQQPFAEHRLRSHGLRGFGILSQALPGPRYLHPKELCFLNTVPQDVPLGVPMRDALYLIGQLAAPMQSLWLCLQLQNWAALQFGGTCPTPEGQLIQFKHRLCHQRHDSWIVPEMLFGGRLALMAGDESWMVVSQVPVTARALALAEGRLRESGTKAVVWHEGRELSPDCLLHFDNATPYVLVFQRKRQAIQRTTSCPCVYTNCTAAGLAATCSSMQRALSSKVHSAQSQTILEPLQCHSNCRVSVAPTPPRLSQSSAHLMEGVLRWQLPWLRRRLLCLVETALSQ